MNKQKPNIVMIMADQWAYNVIGAVGHSAVKTPNIDSLVERGVAFANCYCNSPICAASRAAFVSGRRVSDIGAYDNGAELPASTPTLMHHLRRAGYETILSGKMHFIGPDQLHGFEERLTTDIYPASFAWTPDWTRGAYANYGTSVKRLQKAGVCRWNGQMAYDEEVLYRTLEKVRQLAGAKQKKPFFLCASFTHPHCPFMITQPYWDLYADADIPLPSAPAEPLSQMHPYNQWIQIHHEIDVCELTEEQILRARRAYYGMVTYFDQMVGQIVGEINRMGMLDNTMIVVTSDHGEMLGEHGMWFKRTFYDGSAKVPLVISMPGTLPSGKKVNEVVSLIDLTATLMNVAEVPDSEAWISKMDGDSFLELLERDSADWKDEAIIEYLSEGTIHPLIAIRRGRYKYVDVHRHEPLLFDLASDPYEQNNLAGLPEYSDICADLRTRALGNMDVEQLEQRILQSQKDRMMIARSLSEGSKHPWDYQPFVDASTQYVRAK